MYLVWKQIAKIYTRRKKQLYDIRRKNGVPAETRKSAIENEMIKERQVFLN